MITDKSNISFEKEVEKMQGIKDMELGIKFYKSPSNKQNMWIDGDGLDGERYEVRDIKDVNKSLMDYLEKRECLL